MRRYLVVAHRTLGGRHLLEHLEELRAQGPCRFHLLVPEEHPSDHVWSEAEVRAAAHRRLQEGLDRLHDIGIIADGEVGDANPVYAIGVVLRREGPEAFTGLVLSTLPVGISRWVKLDVPSRVRKEYPYLPMVHLVAEHEPARP
jgi:hypothetical protein